MAEWSKALDSSSSLHLKAWVRIPLEPVLPQAVGPVAQWIARLTSDQAVAGSSPARVAFGQALGGLAQSVECVVCNDEAPGSKPGFSIHIFEPSGNDMGSTQPNVEFSIEKAGWPSG